MKSRKNPAPVAKPDAWYGKRFAIIPESVLLDSRLGPRHLRVLLLLAKHANRDGLDCYPGQDGIAEACGWYITDKTTGEIRSDAALVSRLISNPNHDKPQKNGKPRKDTGPGLVELGYVEILGQRGFSKTNAYRLSIPEYADGDLHVVTDRKLSTEEYAAKQAENIAAKQKEDFSEIEATTAELFESQTKEVEAARIQRGEYIYRGTAYNLAEVQAAYSDGDWSDIPRHVVEHFGYSWSILDDEF